MFNFLLKGIFFLARYKNYFFFSILMLIFWTNPWVA